MMGRKKTMISLTLEPEFLERISDFLKDYEEANGLKSSRNQLIEKAVTEYLDREEKKL